MGYITKVGSFWGMLPETSGRVFWVANADSYTVEGRSYPASDDKDGLSPERAFRTIDYAVGQTTASVGDVIVLLPGVHTVTATVTLDVAGITITGIPGSGTREADRGPGAGERCRSQITTSEATGNIFTFTAAGDDVEIAFLHFNLITGGEGIRIVLGADRPFIHDCTFANVGAASTSSECIHFSSSTTGSVTGAVIRDCDFNEPTSVTTVITNCIDTTGCTVDGNCHIYRCYFTGDAKVGVNSSATVDILVSNCWSAGTTAGRNNVNAAA